MHIKKFLQTARQVFCRTSFLGLVLLGVVFATPLSTYASPGITTLYYNDATFNADWSDLNNWWKDAGYTVPATQLPTRFNNVVVTGTLWYNSAGDPITVNNFNLTNGANWDNGLTITVNGSGLVDGNSDFRTGNIVGNVTFSNSRFWSTATVTGNAVFDSVEDDGNVTGHADFIHLASFRSSYPLASATFADNAYCSGTILGNATFTGSSYLSQMGGQVNGDAAFYENSYNDGLVLGNATFNDSSYTDGGGVVSGYTVLNTNYYTGTVPTGGVYNFSGSEHFDGTYQGELRDSDNNQITQFNFIESSYTGATFTSNATFRDEAFAGAGTIVGNITLYNDAFDSGYVTGNVELHGHSSMSRANTGDIDVYAPVRLPVPTPTGVIRYHDYPMYFFGWNSGDWNDLSNWKRDPNGNVGITALPTDTDDVEMRADITSNSGAPAVAHSINNLGHEFGIAVTVSNGATFRSGSDNSGSITGDVMFLDSSTNNGDVIGNANFIEDGSEFVSGSVSGTKSRVYQTTESTSRDFTLNSPWTVVADGAGTILDISAATIDGTTTLSETNGGVIYRGAFLPIVATASTTSITRTSATLHATLDVIGTDSATTRGFYWGRTNEYGTSTTESDGPYRNGSFSTDINGLECGNTYHFQAWATNITGTATSTDAQFTTSDCPLPTYTLMYTAGSHGTLTGSSTQVVTSGTNGVAVTAVPDSGYVFSSWSDNSTQNPRTDTGVLANITVTANFTEIPVVVVSTPPPIPSRGGGGWVMINSTPVVPKKEEIVVPKTESPFLFKNNLKLGSYGPDVKALQVFLNTHGFVVAKSGVGSLGHETNQFGQATMRALINFQNKNAKNILIPQGLKKGNGIMGPSTRIFINQMILGT